MEQFEEKQELLFLQAISYLKKLLCDSSEFREHDFGQLISFEQVDEWQHSVFKQERWDVLFYGNIQSF
jgi:hypothetical protein